MCHFPQHQHVEMDASQILLAGLSSMLEFPVLERECLVPQLLWLWQLKFIPSTLDFQLFVSPRHSFLLLDLFSVLPNLLEPQLPGFQEEEIPPIPTKVLPKSKWDDEDIDDSDVKDSWEDEDEPEPSQQPVAKAPAEKASKKAPPKSAEKKGKTIEVAKEEPLDPVAEKLRKQRLVEEADYRSTTELFSKKGDDKSLNTFIPKSESDFVEYAELISHKLIPYEKSYHYIALLKAMMRLSLTSLKAADVKDIASSVTAIANEKLKAEKEATTKKKTGGKKKQLHVDKPDDDLVVNAYGDVDDYDFM